MGAALRPVTRPSAAPCRRKAQQLGPQRFASVVGRDGGLGGPAADGGQLALRTIADRASSCAAQFCGDDAALSNFVANSMLIRSIALALVLAVTGSASRADGLADLKGALPRLVSSQPLKARVSVQMHSNEGEGKEATSEQGTASLAVEDDVQGLRLLYGAELLERLRAEDRARERDPQASAPTGSLLRLLGARDVRSMTSAADALMSRLANASFRQESATTWNGQPARLLSFDLVAPPDPKGYVKESNGSLQVWIAADGMPLESQSQLKIKGRAMVVFSFEVQNSTKTVYARWGDRLVATSLEQQQSGSGGGQKGNSKTNYTLQR